jgi:hypothetical protein
MLKNILLMGVAISLFSGISNADESNLESNKLKLGVIEEIKINNRYLAEEFVKNEDKSTSDVKVEALPEYKKEFISTYHSYKKEVITIHTDIKDIKTVCVNEIINTTTCFDYGFGEVFQITQNVTFDLNDKKLDKIVKHFENNLKLKGFVEEETDFLDFKDYKKVYAKDDSLYSFKLENFSIKSISSSKKLQTKKESHILRIKEAEFIQIFDKSLKYIE